MFNFPHCAPFSPDRWLNQDDTVNVGETTLSVRFTPGHTPGHVVFVDEQNENVFVGDVLFQGSVGRTDFPGGNAQQLQTSIKQQLYTLPGTYTVYPGHGPTTTIAHEKAHNPFTSGRFG
jgi:glyoxylase-like metal-dependent hydrolase (beta-lactamase superfamily II)